jgi:hypothetical protein
MECCIGSHEKIFCGFPFVFSGKTQVLQTYLKTDKDRLSHHFMEQTPSWQDKSH